MQAIAILRSLLLNLLVTPLAPHLERGYEFY